MAVKFLSPEWAEAVKSALNASEEFRTAATNQQATIQQIITTAEGGETMYWIKISDGAIDLGVGNVEVPEATIKQSYETAVALANGELNAVTGYMTGKINIMGNMGKLLGLQGALAQLPIAMRSIDTEY